MRFVSNWSWEPAGVKLPVAVRDLVSDEELREGTKLSLGAWDVRVLVERIREENNEEGRPLE